MIHASPIGAQRQPRQAGSPVKVDNKPNKTLDRMRVAQSRVSVERLHELLECEYSTGILRWRVSQRKRKKGKLAGRYSRGRYYFIGIDGFVFCVHRVVWAMARNAWPQMYIDHIDNNGLNNSIGNLRECDAAQNCWNQKIKASSTNNLKGVYYHKHSKSFVAKIRVRDVVYNLGYYKTEEEAHSAYAAAAAKFHGEFARLA